MNKKFAFTVFFIFVGLAQVTYGQINAADGLRMPGDWNGFTNSTNMGGDFDLNRVTNGTLRWTTTFQFTNESGVQNFKFASTGFNSPWDNQWASSNFSGSNTSNNVVYTIDGGSANNTITLSQDKWYTVNFRDNGHANTDAIFLQTSAAPVQIESVSLANTGEIRPGDDITINISTSATPAADEFVYLVYSTDNFATRNVTQVAVTGTSGSVVFEDVAENTTYRYFAITSSIESANLISGQSAAFYDMRSIRVNNNNGDNYTVSVALAIPGQAVITSPTNNATNALLNSTLTWESLDNATSYQIQLNQSSDFTTPDVERTSTGSSFMFRQELDFGTSYFVRVRGLNGDNEAGDWSDVVSFETLPLAKTFSGNQNGGFGSVIGGSTLQIGSTDDLVNIRIVKGAGNFNDAFVMYIANGKTGRNVIDGSVNDTQDGLRRAISSAGENASVLRFPAGFEATHALAINIGFGGIWTIPATGSIENNGLNFVTGVSRTIQTNADEKITVSFSKSDIGLGSEDELSFAFVTTYLNAGNGFLSNESYSIGFGLDNPGANNVNIGSAIKYPSGDVYAMYTLTGSQGWRFLSNPVSGATYQNLLGNLHTQGFAGSGFPGVGAAHSNVRVFDGTSYVSISNITDSPTAGRGFAVGAYTNDVPGEEGSFPKHISFEGTPITGSFAAPLNSTSGQFSLLGNPYVGTLDVGQLTKTGLSNVIYVYDYESSGKADDDFDNNVAGEQVGIFRVWNGSAGSLGSFRVSPFQGFLKHADADNPELTFSDAALASSTTFRGKEQESQNFTASFSVRGQGLYSSAWLHFSDRESASHGLDAHDAMKLYPFSANYGLMQTYAQDGTGLEINHLPLITERTVLPLDIIVTREGTFTFKTDQWELPEGWTAKLIDTKSGDNWSVTANSTIELELGVSAAAKRSASAEQVTPVMLSGSSRFKLVVDPGTTTSADAVSSLPESFELGQNYPNPFNPTTTIQFAIPSSIQAGSNVRLSVFDMLGREVAVLINEARPAGNHTVSFDASALGSGVYVYRLQAGSFTQTKKMTLIK